MDWNEVLRNNGNFTDKTCPTMEKGLLKRESFLNFCNIDDKNIDNVGLFF